MSVPCPMIMTDSAGRKVFWDTRLSRSGNVQGGTSEPRFGLRLSILRRYTSRLNKHSHLMRRHEEW